MVSYLQIQNFILKDKDKKIVGIITNDFRSFCVGKKIKVLNPLSDGFHNGIINDKKVFSIKVFNEYLDLDKRLIKLFNSSHSCTNHFFQAIEDPIVTNFIIVNFDNIYEFLKFKNISVAKEFDGLRSNTSFASAEYSQLLSFIEEFFINNETHYYYHKIINIENVFDKFIEYLTKEYNKDSNLDLDPSFISDLKNNLDIRGKYRDLLFKDNIMESMFNILNEETNNEIIFHRLKKRYYKSFQMEIYPSLDFNLIENYNESELFHNNMLVYLTK
ncbi:MAG: hypothetical protein WC141_04485 [Arcobacteraceae bacterium]